MKSCNCCRETDRGVQLDSEVDLSFGERDQGLEDDGLDDLDNSETGSNGQLNKVSFFAVFYLSWHQGFCLL